MNDQDIYNFFKDAIEERNLKIVDLENAKVLKKDIFYNFSRNCPSLLNALKIANYLEMSVDYILNLTNTNRFKRYCTTNLNFYNNLCKILKDNNLSQNKFCKEMHMSKGTITKWKHGTIPKFSTVIDIANYLKCDIDELLQHE